MDGLSGGQLSSRILWDTPDRVPRIQADFNARTELFGRINSA